MGKIMADAGTSVIMHARRVERVAVLSGPNLAREIMEGQPAAATIACPDEAAAHRVQLACHTSYFGPYTSTDVTGCELGGAVKSVIALAVGIASGMGMGHNSQAMLITRGLAETTRLATAMGAHPATLAGLAGLGDLCRTGTGAPTVRPAPPSGPRADTGDGRAVGVDGPHPSFGVALAGAELPAGFTPDPPPRHEGVLRCGRRGLVAA
nr:hypothetical protein [Streptomyces sp. me109]